MRDENPSVLIVDDDLEFRGSVERLLRTVGLHTEEFSSVSDFLKAEPSNGPTCLVLDVRMPGRSGLELQRDLAAANRQVPIMFITAHADDRMTVQAMKGGAIESDYFNITCALLRGTLLQRFVSGQAGLGGAWR
jgi:FixJ family two-component response regulator